MDADIIEFIQNVLYRWHDAGWGFNVEDDHLGGAVLVALAPDGEFHKIRLPGVG